MIKILLPSRPPGYAPRGTSLGLGGFMLLSGIVPVAVLLSLIPVYKAAIDNFLAALPFCLLTSFIIIVVVSLNLFKRRLWFIYFVFYGSCLALFSYVAGSLLALSIACRLITLQQPELYDLCFFNLLYWTIAGSSRGSHCV